MKQTDGIFRIPRPSLPLDFTGERMTSAIGGVTEVEHYHRYAFARDLCAGLDVVDVASGEGYGAALLAPVACSVVGVEIDSASVAHATANYGGSNLRFVQGAAEAIPLEAASCDLVVSFETIEHLRDQERFLAEVRRILRPNGRFLASTPERRIYSALRDVLNPFHLRELTEEEFKALLGDTFSNVRLWRQRALVGSVLAAEAGSWRSFERRGWKTDDSIEASMGLARAPYVLALASDADLPASESSVYVHSLDVDSACGLAGELQRERDRAAEAAARHVEVTEALRDRVRKHVEEAAQSRTIREDLEQRLVDVRSAMERANLLVGELEAAAHARIAVEADLRSMATSLQQVVSEHVAVEADLRSMAASLQQVVSGHEARIAQQEEELAERDRVITDQQQVIESVRQSYADVVSSEAWQITRPLRWLATRLPTVALYTTRALKLAWWTLTLQLGHRARLWRAHRARLREATAPPAALPPNVELVEPDGVDIIVCVHDALGDVRRCLASLQRNTLPPWRLILVDDGSHDETRDFLRDFAWLHGATLIRHDAAMGYTLAANAGLRAVRASFCVLLNSDTELTEGWLDHLMTGMRADPRLGVAGPLSNTASWQSVPELQVDADWAENPLPPGMTAGDVARLLGERAPLLPVPLGFINGFCMLIRVAALREVGLFDEATFAAGYGEENDFCIRARKAGWQLAVVEQAYVFHHQSRSYGHDRRRVLAARAVEALAAKHDPTQHIGPQVERCRDSLRLRSTRAWLRAGLRSEALVRETGIRHEGRRIAFVLPVTEPGGGANVIHQEARALRRFGVDPVIVNFAQFREGYEASYPELDLPVRYVDPTGDLRAALGFDVDAVVATAWSSLQLVQRMEAKGTVKAYYIQDLETEFYVPGSPQHAAALETYTSDPRIRRITKSCWNRDAILALGGHPPAVIGASVDLGAFRPLSDEGLDPRRPVRVTAMIRPSTPRRAPLLTARVLNLLAQRHGSRVEVSCFGASPEELAAAGIELGELRVLGSLTASEVASLLGGTDVFLDFSAWQAMGLTALEAMASGVAVVVPKRGGAGEFCRDRVNALLADTQDEAACLAAAESLILDASLRTSIRLAAIDEAARHSPEAAALRLLQAVFGQ